VAIAAFIIVLACCKKSEYVTPDVLINNMTLNNSSLIYCNYDFMRVFKNDECIEVMKNDEFYRIPDEIGECIVLESHLYKEKNKDGWFLRIVSIEDLIPEESSDAENTDAENIGEDTVNSTDSADAANGAEPTEMIKPDLPEGQVCVDVPDVPQYVMSALPTEDTSVQNHYQLADYYMNEKYGVLGTVIITKDIYPRVALDDFVRGQKSKLTWRNTGRPNCDIYAVVWNEWDSVYLLQGRTDENGTATFDDFIFRDASSVSLVVPNI